MGMPVWHGYRAAACWQERVRPWEMAGMGGMAGMPGCSLRWNGWNARDAWPMDMGGMPVMGGPMGTGEARWVDLWEARWVDQWEARWVD